MYPGNSIGIVLGCEGKVMKMGKRDSNTLNLYT